MQGNILKNIPIMEGHSCMGCMARVAEAELPAPDPHTCPHLRLHFAKAGQLAPHQRTHNPAPHSFYHPSSPPLLPPPYKHRMTHRRRTCAASGSASSSFLSASHTRPPPQPCLAPLGCWHTVGLSSRRCWPLRCSCSPTWQLPGPTWWVVVLGGGFRVQGLG